MSKQYTDEELIQQLREASEKYSPLSSINFDEDDNFASVSTVSSRFGSWKNACDVANVSCGMVTRNSILSEVKEKYKNGQAKNSEEFFNLNDTVTAATFYEYFDSWRDAVDELGVDMYAHYTENDLLCEIQRFKEEYGYVSERKFKYDDDYPSSSTVSRKLGSWNEAVKKAGVKPNNPGEYGSERREGVYAEYGQSYEDMRERCFQRDSFECRKCGSGENLECHHEKRRVDYETSNVFELDQSNTLENLVTLCRDCHNEIHHSVEQISNDISSLRPRIV